MDDPICTLQASINTAEGGDAVILADGTHAGSGNENISVNGEAITVMPMGG